MGTLFSRLILTCEIRPLGAIVKVKKIDFLAVTSLQRNSQ
jgi:hypothetical protein